MIAAGPPTSFQYNTARERRIRVQSISFSCSLSLSLSRSISISLCFNTHKYTHPHQSIHLFPSLITSISLIMMFLKPIQGFFLLLFWLSPLSLNLFLPVSIHSLRFSLSLSPSFFVVKSLITFSFRSSDFNTYYHGPVKYCSLHPKI